jgi:adenylate cyclase
MATTGIIIRIYEKQQLVYWGEFDEPVEMGRQTASEKGPFFEGRTANGHWRLVVAHADEGTISRKHIQVEARASGQLRIENLSETLTIRLQDRSSLEPKRSVEVSLPYTLRIGKRMVHFHAADAEGVTLQKLAEATLPPGMAPSLSRPVTSLPAAPDLEHLIRWLQGAVAVLHSASSSSDFFQHAARAVVDLVGLDSCGVLLLHKGHWKPEALATDPRLRHEPVWQPSRQILHQVHAEKKTVWQVPQQGTLAGASLAGVKAVVAAPILGRQGDVIGILYGDRRLTGQLGAFHEISKVEAMLVELLASSVAAGLARVEQEKAALTARVQFEQFFTPELSHQLTARPDLLKGQDAEVSILFCDIRGFSRISERLGPALTVEWVSDVLGALSDCALDHHGVIADYLGDEVMTMWGAPERRAGHASLACHAAIEMIARLPALNERWQARIQEPIRLGIGINTGPAWVGNIGSYRKFKYGALGNTVNLASRVQGANKYFEVNILVTASTAAQLDPVVLTRRLGKVLAVNIAEPVDLYEVPTDSDNDWQHLRHAYEDALATFEAGNFAAAADLLQDLLARYPYDGPARVLSARLAEYLTSGACPTDLAWRLPGK